MATWEKTELLTPGFFKEFSGGAASFDPDDDFTIVNTIANGDCVVRFEDPLIDYQWLEITTQAFDPFGELSQVSFLRDIEGLNGPIEVFGAEIFGRGIVTFKVPYVGELEGFRWTNIHDTVKIHSIKAVQRTASLQKVVDLSKASGSFIGWIVNAAQGTYKKTLTAAQASSGAIIFNPGDGYCYVKVEVDNPIAQVAINYNGQDTACSMQLQEYIFDATDISPKNITITAHADIGCTVTITILYASFPVGLSAFGGGAQVLPIGIGAGPGTSLLTQNNDWQGFNNFSGGAGFAGTGYIQGHGSGVPASFSPTIPVADVVGAVSTTQLGSAVVWGLTGVDLLGFRYGSPYYGSPSFALHSVGYSLTQRLYNIAYATDFGIVPDNATVDQTTKLQNALNEIPINCVLLMQPGRYLFNTLGGITIPYTKMLEGLSIAADAGNAGQLGVELVFGANVTDVCITLTGGPASGRSAMKKVTVSRTGATPANVVGILVTGVNDALLEDIYVFKQAHGVKLAGSSLGTSINRVTTTQITKSHIWIASGIETHIHECRFGKNGGLDVNCEAYVRIGGNSDTCWISQTNFNQSAGTVGTVLLFDALTSGNGLFTLSQCHIEVPTGTSNTIDAINATASIPRVSFVGTSINHAGRMFGLGVTAGMLTQFNMVAIPFVLPAATFLGITSLSINGAYFLSAVTFDGGSGGVKANFAGSVTITGAMTGIFLDLALVGGGALTNSASGKYQLRHVNSDPTNNAAATQQFNGIVELLNGKLKFPSAQSSSSNVNTLDDYVESPDNLTCSVTLQTPGTSVWTPTENNYRYTKIGREIHIEFNAVGSFTKGTGTGIVQLIFGAFPYLSANTTSNHAIGTVMWGDALTAAGFTQMVCIIGANANNCTFTWCGAGTIPLDLTAAHMPVGAFTLRFRGRITITAPT